MSLDLILRQAAIVGRAAPVDIGVRGGLIAEIAPRIDATAREVVVDGRLVTAGFVDTHVHLDKSCIAGRCNCQSGTLQEAIAAVAEAKRGFTEDDIYQRGQRTLEKAILQGTGRMRTHVEVDPRIGLKGFHAVRALKQAYRWAIDLQICVFPQEGLLNDPGAEALLIEACENGADLIGGCPYADSDPLGQIARIFDIATRFNLDIDFHLDFDLDPTWMHLDEVCRQTERHRRGGRVAAGHVTKLSAVSPEQLAAIATRLAGAGVALTTLPATDLFLMGAGSSHNVPRGVAPLHRLVGAGVTCSLATNNVLNPFTPFGDCSLIRMANLYANIAQIGTAAGLESCFEMITTQPARMMRLDDYGVAVGKPAHLVVLDARTPADAVAEIAPPLFGLRDGSMTFSRPAGELLRPAKLAAVRTV
ncbi:amidohydrolase family protein [Bradyrhizobium prioriisuperbiae]|uniref:amidohydrolase family protein n=1 Tax=Bradyrhizobium prioriisuperbiae TaxID=2854389 RepID=UPI0028ECA15B|nr:amidohydrolase family protein [Bradyrhizobium prioritasuperba]